MFRILIMNVLKSFKQEIYCMKNKTVAKRLEETLV